MLADRRDRLLSPGFTARLSGLIDWSDPTPGRWHFRAARRCS